VLTAARTGVRPSPHLRPVDREGLGDLGLARLVDVGLRHGNELAGEVHEGRVLVVGVRFLAGLGPRVRFHPSPLPLTRPRSATAPTQDRGLRAVPSPILPPWRASRLRSRSSRATQQLDVERRFRRLYGPPPASLLRW